MAAAAAELGEAPIVAVGPLEYRSGRGLRFGPTGLTIGGFTDAKAEYGDDVHSEFSLDQLNFFFIYVGCIGGLSWRIEIVARIGPPADGSPRAACAFAPRRWR